MGLDAVGPWTPAGVRIGWLDGADLYLDSALACRVAQKVAGAERIPVSERTLRVRLNERGLLVSTDLGRETLNVRRAIEGHGREVLHLPCGNRSSARPPGFTRERHRPISPQSRGNL